MENYNGELVPYTIANTTPKRRPLTGKKGSIVSSMNLKKHSLPRNNSIARPSDKHLSGMASDLVY